MSFLTLGCIREFVQSHQSKTITSTNPVVFQQFKTLVSQHPSWKDKIDTIEKFKVCMGMNKQNTILKIKPDWSKYFITISWRKCKPIRLCRKPNEKKDKEKEEKDVNESKNRNGNMDVATKSISSLIYWPCMISSTDISLFNSIVTSPQPPKPPLTTLTTPQPPLTTPSSLLSNVLENSPSPTPTTVTLTGAMRYAIRRQIQLWKVDNRLLRRCRQCQSVLCLHVDHITPFVNIQHEFLKLWMDTTDQSPPSKFRYNHRTCQPMFTRSDTGFTRKWQSYHKTHAKLQWLCRKCNLKKGCKN